MMKSSLHVGLLALAVCICSCRPQCNCERVAVAPVPGKAFLVDYGFTKGDKLEFVIFQGGNSGFNDATDITNVMGGDGRRKGCYGTVRFPDGKIVDILDLRGGVEMVDGGFNTFTIRCSRREFEAFLQSSPRSYSIQSLTEFLGKR